MPKIATMLKLADPPTTIHEPLAPPPPDAIVHAQRRGQRSSRANRCSARPDRARHLGHERAQAQRILDAHAHSGPVVRTARVHRVAGHADPPVVVSLKGVVVHVEHAQHGVPVR